MGLVGGDNDKVARERSRGNLNILKTDRPARSLQRCQKLSRDDCFIMPERHNL